MRTRPINLNLLKFHFPLPAIVSILHRISGLLLIILIPFLLFTLQESLDSAESFETLKGYFSHPLLKGGLWVFICALGYHLLAGIRHLLMDMQIGDSLRAGRFSAKIVIILAVVLVIGAGFWLGWK